MMTVVQSFENLQIGVEIKVKNWDYNPKILRKKAKNQLVVGGNGPESTISYDLYQYSLIPNWPFGMGLRYLAIRYDIEELCEGMHIKTYGSTDSWLYLNRNGDSLRLRDGMNDRDLFISYEADYNFSLVSPNLALEIERDPLQKLALSILCRDPMALDAAKDILRC